MVKPPDHLWPEFLPDGQAVLFTITATTGGLDNAQVAILDLGTGTYTGVPRGGHHARYLRTGHLVYGAGGALRAVPFDLARREVTGARVLILDAVMTTTNGGIDVTVADTGARLYLSAHFAGRHAHRPRYPRPGARHLDLGHRPTDAHTADLRSRG